MMSLPVTGERNVGGVHHRLLADGGEIVAIEIDIQNADRNFALFERFDLASQSLRQRHAAAADADERQLVQIRGFFQNFVRQPDQRPVDFGRAHQLAFFAGGAHRVNVSG